MATDIILTNLTNGETKQDSHGKNYWKGTGVFDVLMGAVNDNIKIEYDNARLQGQEYASVYLGAMQSVISQSMQYLLTEQSSEAQTDLVVAQESELLLNGIKERSLKDALILKIDEETDLLQTQDTEMVADGLKDRLVKDAQIIKIQEDTDLVIRQETELALNGTSERNLKAEQLASAVIKNYIDEATKGDKVATSASALAVTQGTQPHKISLAQYQSAKAAADTDYVVEQEQQLINSVQFNNEIKALDSLADTYGTFGAGGLTLSSEMWQTYFAIVAKLATVTAPTVTTVTKVT